MVVPDKLLNFISDHTVLRIIRCDIRTPVSLLLQHCLSVDGSFMSLGQMVALREFYFYIKVTLKYVASIMVLTYRNIKPASICPHSL
jgi:hypothetical protein